jgi:hypothetical protein
MPDGVEGPIDFILGGVVNSLIAVEKQVKAPGGLSAGAIGYDWGEILRLAQCEAPKDAKDMGVLNALPRMTNCGSVLLPFKLQRWLTVNWIGVSSGTPPS